MLVHNFFSRALFPLTNKRLKRFMGHIFNFELESLYFVIIKKTNISIYLKGPPSSGILLWGVVPGAAHLAVLLWMWLRPSVRGSRTRPPRAGGFTLPVMLFTSSQSWSLGVLWMVYLKSLFTVTILYVYFPTFLCPWNEGYFI